MAQHTEATFQDAEEPRRIRLQEERIEFELEWESLSDEVYMAWEPLRQIQEDLPELLTQLINTPGSRKLKEKLYLSVLHHEFACLLQFSVVEHCNTSLNDLTRNVALDPQ